MTVGQSIILNLGISSGCPYRCLTLLVTYQLYLGNWQAIDLTTMIFPAIMQVDYVRVYQRKGHTNIGCDPPDYPTKNYIDNHSDAYASTHSCYRIFNPILIHLYFPDPNLTYWSQPQPVGAGYSWPKNSAVCASISVVVV